MLLSFFSLVDILVILHLLGTGSIDLVYGIWFQSLEVVWNISVLGKLGGSGHWVLGHEITHIGSCNFLLVHVLLLISPGLFSISFLLGKHLVVGLHILELLIFLISHLIFEKSTHSSNSLCLLSIGMFLILERLIDAFFL